MDAQAYDAFTAALQGSLAGRPDVLGLVALGSMAGRDYQPDEFSDHDFFVVAAPPSAEPLREDLSWLPARDRVLLSFRETAHGLKVLYDDGHLLELAVFAPDELALASVNRYRVLLDRADVATRMEAVARATAEASAAGAPTDDALLGLFLSALLVGVGRHLRGERASGRNLVHGQALRHLLRPAGAARAQPALRPPGRPRPAPPVRGGPPRPGAAGRRRADEGDPAGGGAPARRGRAGAARARRATFRTTPAPWSARGCTTPADRRDPPADQVTTPADRG